MAWSYAQVAGPSGVQAAEGDQNTVEWSNVGAVERMNGHTEPEGVSTRTPLLGEEREIIVHTHDLDDATTSRLRQVVLRDVLGDLGVLAPTSTAAGLSRADRDALVSRCARSTAGTHATATPSASPAPGGTAAAAAPGQPSTTQVTALSARPVLPSWVAFVALGVIVLGVAALWAPQWLRARVAAPLRGLRSRIRRRGA